MSRCVDFIFMCAHCDWRISLKPIYHQSISQNVLLFVLYDSTPIGMNGNKIQNVPRLLFHHIVNRLKIVSMSFHVSLIYFWENNLNLSHEFLIFSNEDTYLIFSLIEWIIITCVVELQKPNCPLKAKFIKQRILIT